jgi:adenosine deaminase
MKTSGNTSDNRMDWRSLPKVELHLHLDISLSFEGAAQLEPGLTPEVYAREFVAPARCADLADFLGRVPRLLGLLQSERGLALVVQDVFHQLAEDQVLYAELRFAPMLHTQGGLSPQEVVGIVEKAVEQNSQDSGIEARLILCTLRHFSAEQSLQTVALVEQFRGSRVAGFDLAGDEAGYPLDAHLEAFRVAREKGIPFTSHAGEARGASSVWETLREIHPPRLGHGVRSLEDPALVAYLRRQQVHLEICPTCNVQLNVFPSYAKHSLAALYRQQVPLSISTDNRALTPITLTREYEKLAAAFGWGSADFLTVNLSAIQAAFAPQPIREALRRRIIQAYEGA